MNKRKLPIGAETSGSGVQFRVWAPRRRTVAVECDGRTLALAPEAGGYFGGVLEDAGEGLRYRFRLDGDETRYPDPASRFQPEGPHGPSEVVDPARFDWTDGAWRGVALPGQVIYELHVGTFTREGTWEAAIPHLAALRDVGVTVLELLPVAEWAGRFGWGYDGVDLFAPYHVYGRPDDFRRFVNAAHRLGLGVILDVVYNHLGPSGNYLAQFAEGYFTQRHATEWGAAIDFDGEHSAPVRELFVSNAAYWIDEYHLDGLRLDATQCIHDTSPVHVIEEVGRAVRTAARGRDTLLIAENERQDGRLTRSPERGGLGLDAAWNDDFHHSARVAMTGRREAYYTDYRGSPQELISAVRRGYLFQGQRYRWQKFHRRGTPALDLPPAAFVTYLQNHDQVANSADGRRLHDLAGAGLYRAITALWLLAPGTPMLFQGQEFAASARFLYFADHEPELAEQVARGRAEFLAQFPSIARPEVAAELAAPHDPATFAASQLDHRERERGPHAQALALHRDLLALRRQAPFAAQDAARLEGAVLDAEVLALRWMPEDGAHRLLIVNLGRETELREAAEPLLAPPAGCEWVTEWWSDALAYGGDGEPATEGPSGWRLPAYSATVLAPRTAPEPASDPRH